MHISKAEAVNEMRKSMGGFFRVTFTKKNGEERRMTCRLGVKSHRKTEDRRPTTWHIPRYVTVWDVHKRGYRNINVNTLIELKVNRKQFTVA